MHSETARAKESRLIRCRFQVCTKTLYCSNNTHVKELLAASCVLYIEVHYFCQGWGKKFVDVVWQPTSISIAVVLRSLPLFGNLLQQARQQKQKKSSFSGTRVAHLVQLAPRIQKDTSLPQCPGFNSRLCPWFHVIPSPIFLSLRAVLSNKGIEDPRKK